MTRPQRHVLVTSALLLVARLTAVRAAPASDAASKAPPATDGGAATVDTDSTLKNNFVSDTKHRSLDVPPPARQIGRLTIHLHDADGSRPVPVSYPFRSGDRLHFEVSANRDGWLYVLHRGPNGRLEHLWPMPTDESATSTINRLHERATVLIPPAGTFEFDEETGNEHFYFVVRSERGWPDLSGAPLEPVTPRRARSKSSSPQPKPQMASARVTSVEIPAPPAPVNFRVRGLTYVPPAAENDQSIYFAALAPSEASQAILEFQLTHQP